MNKADMIEKDSYIMWDAINGDFYEHDSLDSVLKDLKENYCDPEEGIHPDIETIQIFKEVADVVLEQVEGKETYRVKVVPRAAYIAGRTVGGERESRLEELVRAFHDDLWQEGRINSGWTMETSWEEYRKENRF